MKVMTKLLHTAILLLVVFAATLVVPAGLPLGPAGGDLEPYAVRRVQPAYPPLAQKLRIEGSVLLDVKVAANGVVAKADFRRGHSIFRSASLDAVKRWKFRSGDELEGTITLIFEIDD